MKVFNKFKRMLIGIASAIQRRLTKNVKMTPGASSVKSRVKTLKRLGVNNDAMKKLKSFEDLFFKRHNKSLYSADLDEYEYEEAYNIFEAFLSDNTSNPIFIEETYGRYEEEGLVKGASSIAQMAKEIDIVNNRAIAKEIYDVLGSPVVNEVWQDFKSKDEDRENVNIMKKAIMNTTAFIENGGVELTALDKIKLAVKQGLKGKKYTEEDVNQFTSQKRKDKVLSEYKRLKRKGLSDYL